MCACVAADSGREIEIIAGVRTTAASSDSKNAASNDSKKSSKSSLSTSSAPALFEVMEDIEQQPIMTPLYVTSVSLTVYHCLVCLSNETSRSEVRLALRQRH